MKSTVNKEIEDMVPACTVYPYIPLVNILEENAKEKRQKEKRQKEAQHGSH